MPMHVSRVPKTVMDKRPLTSDEILLKSLNLEPMLHQKPVTKDIVDGRALLLFVKRLQQIEVIRQSHGFDREGLRRASFKEISGLSRAVRRMNSFLDRYVLRPVLMPRAERDDENGIWKFHFAQRGRSAQPFVEFARIQKILQLADEGRLSKLKQCEQCKRWLLARFAHQRFCPGGKCKEDFHRSNPADKARRREWARNNYQLHKTKNVK